MSLRVSRSPELGVVLVHHYLNFPKPFLVGPKALMRCSCKLYLMDVLHTLMTLIDQSNLPHPCVLTWPRSHSTHQ